MIRDILEDLFELIGISVFIAALLVWLT